MRDSISIKLLNNWYDPDVSFKALWIIVGRQCQWKTFYTQGEVVVAQPEIINILFDAPWQTEGPRYHSWKKTLAGSWHHSRVNNNSTMLQIYWTECQNCLKKPLLMGHHPKLDFNSAQSTELDSCGLITCHLYRWKQIQSTWQWWSYVRWDEGGQLQDDCIIATMKFRGGAIMVWEQC